MSYKTTLRSFLMIGVMLCALCASCANPAVADETGLVRLPGHVSATAAHSATICETAPSTRVSLAIVLPLRNESDLDATLSALYDPASAQFHHFLSSSDFMDRYAPTDEDYQAVAAYAKSKGLVVTGIHENRLVLDVTGPAAAIEDAFNVRLANYVADDGRLFIAPDSDPAVPQAVAAKIQSVVGLDNSPTPRANFVATPAPDIDPYLRPFAGSANGLYIPSDIRTAYNVPNTVTGAGQTLGLMELDGYTASDIAKYEQTYQLPAVTLKNVLIDGFNGAPSYTGGEVEVSLDIELQLAIAPGASAIMVYEGPCTYQGLIDTYNRIAEDDKATEISSSWGVVEYGMTNADSTAENTIFKQIAAQGQSLYAASGDSGAYADGATVCVQDPASQPYCCGVGGTELQTNTNHGYVSETTWNEYANGWGAGGGGESAVWPKPSYQKGYGSSRTMRDVPDVSLNADPVTGYQIYADGYWMGVGGTSCAAPLWAGFTALVNQQRATNKLAPMGFPNAAIYRIATGPNAAADLHDIADDSNNLYYIAIPGYDDATGWGSFNGTSLFADLSAANPPAAHPVGMVGGLSASLNASGEPVLNWTAPAGGSLYFILRSSLRGGPYGCVGIAGPTSQSALTFTDTSVAANQTVYYVVAAGGMGNVGPYSAEVSVKSGVAPAAPTNLAAKAVSATQINLTWTASAKAAGYIVFRGRVSGGPYVQVGTPATPAFSDTGLGGYTTYYYVVQATASGTSPNSSQASATTLAGIVAAPAGLTAAAPTSIQVNLTWTASTGATSYTVFRGAVHNGPYTQIGASTTPAFADPYVTCQTSYYYVIDATNSYGVSPYSAEASVTTPQGPPGPPTNLGVQTTSSTQLSLGWWAPGGKAGYGYNVLRGAKHGGPYTQVGTSSSCSFADKNLSVGTTYYYIVQATNSYGTSPSSAEASGTTFPPAPSAPTALVAKTAPSQVTLTWSPSATAAAYLVYVGTAHNGPYSLIASTTSCTYTQSNVAGGSLLYYVVRATNAGGQSAYSAEASATVPPAAPYGVSATVMSATQVNLTWCMPIGATGYLVLRGTKSGGPYATQIGTATACALSDKTCTAATTYYYVIEATNAGGAGPSSAQVTATTLPLPPPAPMGLKAAAASASQINLTWTASAGATGYTVSSALKTGGPYTKVGTSTAASFNNTGLAKSTAYFYVVQATNAGGASANSTQATATTPAK